MIYHLSSLSFSIYIPICPPPETPPHAGKPFSCQTSNLIQRIRVIDQLPGVGMDSMNSEGYHTMKTSGAP